jgi:hypothetical protein
MVCLIKFTEAPEYRCQYQDLTDSEVESLNYPPPTEIRKSESVFTTYRGPVTYKGLQLSEGFLEIWKNVDGIAVLEGERKVVLL